MIVFENVTKRYEGTDEDAVQALSMTINEGEWLVLLGASGSGKTTTLKMINRLIDHTSGRLTIDGEDVRSVEPTALRRRIGYVIQGIGLFPHMTAAENVAVVPRLLRWPKTDIDKRVQELLELIGLPMETFGDRRPDELSGGQQQRIGVARALATRPSIMLMDEPFGALDPLTREDLQNDTARLQKKLGITIVMVTHDMTEALLLADRIGVMHEGGLIAIDTPSNLLRNPPNDQVASLLKMPKEHADRLEELAAAPPNAPPPASSDEGTAPGASTGQGSAP